MTAAYTAGVSPLESYDWTWGELIDAVKADRERQKRRLQEEAVIQYYQSFLIGRVLNGKRGTKMPEAWEAFPGVWSDEEVRNMKLQKYKQIMERHAAMGGAGNA